MPLSLQSMFLTLLPLIAVFNCYVLARASCSSIYSPKRIAKFFVLASQAYVGMYLGLIFFRFVLPLPEPLPEFIGRVFGGALALLLAFLAIQKRSRFAALLSAAVVLGPIAYFFAFLALYQAR